ncbi:ABC-F family ATP-binding cassette domain-containing protein [Aquibacillus sp. 3ASR75-11]|uniref:ABC-F family ATP-binding cassette domain-containing protein n=1 Tax=Terrihalobacillus insolitus TaxID=2950438 RepID=A0A9X3WYQ2_9BACI|nr:ABC-F family ATP-binding cassette domain-containing protein [Terrihalobacillus insolitus]MDC3425749.1 ABC-F family ATP-binding cassette domain-containing protein [Terrihalobacillus insolitus]
MSILSVENLYKSYGEKILFDHISFTIESKERIGLIGVNGTGKSTLLKVIAGIESKDNGTINHSNDFKVEYLPQEPMLDGDLTVLEQIFQGDSPIIKTMRDYEQVLSKLEMNPDNEQLQEELIARQQKMDQLGAWDMNTIAKTILTKLGVASFSKNISQLSGGQMKRVAIARALLQPADLLILDEPTNHLDNETIEWLESYLPQYKGSLLLVTHDRYFLNRITNRIYELDNGKLYTYDGNYEMFLEKKAEREEQELLQEQKHQNTLRRELEWLRRGAKARTTKQKARKQRVEDMKERRFATDDASIAFQVGSSRLGKKVIEIRDITKRFGNHHLLKPFSLLIVPNDRIGMIGPNGSGKSTLLNMIANRTKPDTGVIEIGPTVKIGYYTQEHQFMDENSRVIDYIKEVAEVVYTAKGDVITAEQMLERFLFPRPQQWTYVKRLSGGERRRLYLLRVLMDEPNVLLLDEPTNDLDTETLSILEEYLDQFPGVVITVSHDRYFLDRVVDHLIAFEGDGVTRHFYGNYTQYLTEKQLEKKATSETKEKKEPFVPKKKRKLSYHEQKEWDGIEDSINHLEEETETIQTKIQQAGSDINLVQQLYQEQEQLEKELEQKMERWEELASIVEQIEKENEFKQ